MCPIVPSWMNCLIILVEENSTDEHQYFEKSSVSRIRRNLPIRPSFLIFFMSCLYRVDATQQSGAAAAEQQIKLLLTREREREMREREHDALFISDARITCTGSSHWYHAIISFRVPAVSSCGLWHLCCCLCVVANL